MPRSCVWRICEELARKPVSPEVSEVTHEPGHLGLCVPWDLEILHLKLSLW